MKLLFAGTPHFAAAALRALHGAGHEIALVLTQPDRPSGRGMKLTSTPVAQEAQCHSLPLEKPATLKSPEIQALLRDVNADVFIVAAYGQLLPPAVLEIPRFGCLNIHASLLPRWRGAAPIQRAIEAGDSATGISIMQMDAGLDTGAVLLEKKIPIATDETSGSLLEKLTVLGATSIVEVLTHLKELVPRPQSSADSTYAAKIGKSEARIDWTQSALSIERRMRAFDPFPGCETRLNKEQIKIWRAAIVNNDKAGVAPGTIVHVDPQVLTVQCGQGQLELTIVQKPGGRRVPIREFLQQTSLANGAQFS